MVTLRTTEDPQDSKVHCTILWVGVYKYILYRLQNSYIHCTCVCLCVAMYEPLCIQYASKKNFHTVVFFPLVEFQVLTILLVTVRQPNARLTGSRKLSCSVLSTACWLNAQSGGSNVSVLAALSLALLTFCEEKRPWQIIGIIYSTLCIRRISKCQYL